MRDYSRNGDTVSQLCHLKNRDIKSLIKLKPPFFGGFLLARQMLMYSL